VVQKPSQRPTPQRPGPVVQKPSQRPTPQGPGPVIVNPVPVSSSTNQQASIKTMYAIIDTISSTPQGYLVTISYGVGGNNNQNTKIYNEFNRIVSPRYLQPAMVINAVFSENMTRSNPPQAIAYRIEVVSRPEQIRVKTDFVLQVDPVRRILLTGTPNVPGRQIQFNISNSTQILNKSGTIISLDAIKPGDFVRVEYANFQTSSIPPQTVPYRIILLR